MASEKYEQPKEGASIDREYSKDKNAKVTGAGLYRHPNGTSAIVQDDPLFGNAQAQAFARLGFVFEREALPGEIKSLPEIAADTRKTEEDSLKGLSARLSALETVAEDNKALKAEIATLRAEKSARDETDKTKESESGSESVEPVETPDPEIDTESKE
jgi:hypothetical protein